MQTELDCLNFYNSNFVNTYNYKGDLQEICNRHGYDKPVYIIEKTRGSTIHDPTFVGTLTIKDTTMLINQNVECRSIKICEQMAARLALIDIYGMKTPLENHKRRYNAVSVTPAALSGVTDVLLELLRGLEAMPPDNIVATCCLYSSLLELSNKNGSFKTIYQLNQELELIKSQYSDVNESLYSEDSVFIELFLKYVEDNPQDKINLYTNLSTIARHLTKPTTERETYVISLASRILRKIKECYIGQSLLTQSVDIITDVTYLGEAPLVPIFWILSLQNMIDKFNNATKKWMDNSLNIRIMLRILFKLFRYMSNCQSLKLPLLNEEKAKIFLNNFLSVK
jgi:hypothetical protein